MSWAKGSCAAPTAPLSSEAPPERAESGRSWRVCWVVEAVTEATDRCDYLTAEFLANARYEDFDRVRIAVEILIINMLD